MPERAYHDPKERLDKTMERLKEGVDESFESGRYQEYLSVMSRFHRYNTPLPGSSPPPPNARLT
jgi:hypothetical protein